MTEQSLPSLFAAEQGVTCVVGAGGKKTTIYRLANELHKAVVTSTVRIPIFDKKVRRVYVTESPETVSPESSEWPVGIVPEQERSDRYRGFDPTTIDEFASKIGDPVLVKADGARTRHLKAPDSREPQIPSTASTVIPIASARAIGKQLTEDWVHRPERVADITGKSIGDNIEPADIAAVLGSKQGGLKQVPSDATVVGLINMVDTEADKEQALAAAKQAINNQQIEQIILAQMIAENPIVEQVTH